ncbi:MAG: hypothetical protein Q9186_006340 [Xanthomendoza sp. 1 TL-2023]
MDQRGLNDGLLVNRAYSGLGAHDKGRNMNTGKEKSSNAKSRWPHALNVVTNFSKPPQLAQQAANAVRRPEQDAVDAFVRGHRRLNSSADIKTPDAYKRSDGREEKPQQSVCDRNQDAAIGLGFQRFENTRKAPSPPRDNKGPIHDLRRASSKMTTLSPNDRQIVIAFSIPSDKLEQHNISPDAGPTPVTLPRAHSAKAHGPSDAPSIIITSAKAEAPWAKKVDEQFEVARRRAPSSVYSRATNAQRTPKQTNVPPMPTLPRRSLSLSSNVEPTRPVKTSSTYTMFDEDDSPKESHPDHRFSGESQLRILKRSSTDSIATKHRSQGWWTHIVSPFLPKNGTVPWGSKDAEPIPDMPELAPAAPLVHQDEPSDSRAPFVAARPRRSSSDHTSIWTDASPIGTEQRPEDITMLRSPFRENRRGFNNHDQDLSDWFQGLGEAAEYYHACWHDQNYSSPYFECQDHVCDPQRICKYMLPQGSQEDSKELPEVHGEAYGVDGRKEPKHTEADEFQQVPTNRFEAAFREAITPRPRAKERPLSETTVIEDVDATPIVQEAQAAPVVRAPLPVLASQQSSYKGEPENNAAREVYPIPPRNDSTGPPPTIITSPLARPTLKEAPPDMEPPIAVDVPSRRLPVSLPSNPKPDKPAKRFVAVMPPDHPSVAHAQPMSPTAPSSAMHPKDGLAVTELPQRKALESRTKPGANPTTVINHYHHYPRQKAHSDQITLNDMYPSPRPLWFPREIKGYGEKEKRESADTAKKGRGCQPRLTSCLNRGKPKTKKQKWLLIGITSALVAMMILILLLAMLLTRKGDHMEVQSQWLNLTGFPPIPTGISTIIQPDPVQASSGCIHPATLWSCAVPKEQQALIAPNGPDQPNFRIEIRFQNSSIADGPTSNDTALSRRSASYGGIAARAANYVRTRPLHIRDITNNLFTPSPSPPKREDQIFLGNTTDQNQQPFDGAATPFFISFVNPRKLASSRMTKRASTTPDTDSNSNGTASFPNIGAAIPLASTNADGTASPALLYPLASAQPLRLYNRDMATEHYGFYTYFDRSIFLKSTALLNFTNETPSEIAEDENGGAEETAATVRCTWAQTRFLVQIWTRKGIAASLLQSGNSSIDTSPGSKPQNLTASSANDFTRPGSFPYPVSITVDRHGGDIKKKMIYCYGLDQQQRIISDQKQIQLEDRAFGGSLVNPAQGPFGEVKVSGDDGGPGGIDGGNGGCGCRWENFSNGGAQ